MRGLTQAMRSSPPGARHRRELLAGASASLLAAAGLWPWPARAGSQRIVSVGGAITETLYALGAQGDVVGVDTTSYFPEAAKKLPSVGYQRTLSTEGVLSLAPTLVLANEDAGPPAVLRQIEAARVAVHVIDSGHSVEGVLARTQRVADLAGRTDAGKALIERLRGEWLAAQARVAALAPGDASRAPRVLFLMAQSINQMRAAGSSTGPDALIRYVGARNAFGSVEGYKLLSPEAAVAAAPDVIIVTDHGLNAVGGKGNLLRAPGLAQTPAARSQRVGSVEILLTLGFGPRLPLAVSSFAEAVYARPTAS
jgi:iron complex transport system substrate-binding protein